MRKFRQSLSLQDIQNITGGDVYSSFSIELDTITDPIHATSTSIVFCEDEKYLPLMNKTLAGLIIINPKNKAKLNLSNKNFLVVDKPYQAVLKLMNYWLSIEKEEFVSFVHQTALISKKVDLPEFIQIGAYTVIADDVVLGNYTTINSHCTISKNSVIGEHCLIHPHVTIYEDTIIKNRVVIHAGAVIGSDGFGYLLFDGKQNKIPQIGNVFIDNDVEIGANTTIDRATIGSTIIGEGTKIDNQVQIGHNCTIGKHCILCAQVGMAGSTTIGDYVYLAGQVGTAGHITIGDRTMVGAKSGVAGNLPADGKYLGIPAKEASLMRRIFAAQSYLPDIFKRYIKYQKKDV